MALPRATEPRIAVLAALGLVALVDGYRIANVTNPTIVALSLLTIVLAVAATSTRRLAVATSLGAMVAFNYFFLPPVGTLSIADPENWVALVVFLAVSLVASGLSAAVRASEHARQSEALKSALLASLAHDLKTPLTAIRVAADNLQADWLADNQRREQSEIVLTEVARLTHLFESILDMARIDAGAVASTRQWVHPSETVDVACTQVAHALRDHTVDLQEDAGDLVFIDPRLTSAALAHLLENAAAYSPAGSTITVTAGVTPAGLRVTVRDRGPGITPADLPQLFDRFFRGTSARGVAGTGMGLAIARGLLAVEGGSVWAENHPHGGALFSLTVPASTRHLEPAAEATT